MQTYVLVFRYLNQEDGLVGEIPVKALLHLLGCVDEPLIVFSECVTPYMPPSRNLPFHTQRQ